MADIELVPYRDTDKSTWDGVVRASRNGNFLHLRDYMGYHAHRFDEQSLIVQRRSRPIAVFPCNRVHDRIISHGGLTYGGLLYGNEVRAAEVLSILRQLGDYYRSLGCSTLLYKAIPSVFHRYPAQEDLYALWRMGARLVRRDLSTVVQLANRLAWSDSRKNTIRKAQKQGLVLREGDFFEAFLSLLAAALAKYGVTPVHTLNELQLLKSRFPDRIRLFGAFAGHRLLAGALMYDFGHIVHSQNLASSEDGRVVGALDYVLAHLLGEVFSHRQWFSFGISTDQEGQHLNEGLVFQKEGFGGRAVVHDFYEWEL